MSPRSVDPSDLSPLLFRRPGETPEAVFEPFVGPIRLTQVSKQHGRGLVAERDIAAGECLFVIPPTLSVKVEDVHKQWKSQVVESSSSDDTTTTSATSVIEHVAEDALRKAMQDALQRRDIATIRSFLALVGSSSTMISDENCLSIDRLLGKDANEGQLISDDEECTTAVSDTDLLQMIRRNAFGPDFVTYPVIERRWKADSDDPSFLPSRILGLYPLAAMINHSCAPNALRVFVPHQDWMMVHASEAIAAGEEIVWSYLPPTLPFPERQRNLLEQHSFSCDCRRCAEEASVWEESSPTASALQVAVPWSSLSSSSNAPLSGDDMEARAARSAAVQSLENGVLSDKSISNEVKRYLRVGFTHLYIQYLNAVVAQNESAESLLTICTQLHFAFCACDNACTEHLSILHLCYELIGKMHTTAVDKSKTLPKLRFWTEQLKRACMVRYGSLGNDLNAVRTVMQHSRTVLRNQNGLDKATYAFI